MFLCKTNGFTEALKTTGSAFKTKSCQLLPLSLCCGQTWLYSHFCVIALYEAVYAVLVVLWWILYVRVTAEIKFVSFLFESFQQPHS